VAAIGNNELSISSFCAPLIASNTLCTTSSEYCVLWHAIARRDASKSAASYGMTMLRNLGSGIRNGISARDGFTTRMPSTGSDA
jgi:hypothetical protein